MKKIRSRVVFETAIFASALYISWRILFTIPFSAGWPSVLSGCILLLAEIMGMIDFVCNFIIMSKKKKYPVPQTDKDSQWPDVDVFIATYNESCDLLYKTIHGCLRMEYPESEKVHIYLCDDGNRPAMRELAASCGIHYLNRADHEGAKAGNLNNALAHSSSPYIVTFDADMYPRSSFLMKTIPYFMAAEKANKNLPDEEKIELGFQQTPQSFYNWDLFQSRLYAENELSNEQDFFYREIEVAKTQFNAVIYGGSNTVISRKALEAVGGFYTKAITEDFATGLLIEGAGFVSLGTGEPLAAGLAPEDIPSLIQQRIRWGRGCVNVFHSIPFFFQRKYSFGQKMNYWSSISYWLSPITRLIYFLIPILSGLFRLQVVKAPFLHALGFWLLMFLANTAAIKVLSNQMRTSRWSDIYEAILFPFLVGPVFLELIGIELKTFHVTEKNKNADTGIHFRYLWPFIILLALTIAALIRILTGFLTHHELTSGITLFWLFYNVMLEIMSILFMIGRRSDSAETLRSSSVEALVSQNGKQYESFVRGLSEYEMEVIWPSGLESVPQETVKIDLKGFGDHCQVKGTIEQTFQNAGQTSSFIQIEETADYDHFLKIVYDRAHKDGNYHPRLFLYELLRYFNGRWKGRRKVDPKA